MSAAQKLEYVRIQSIQDPLFAQLHQLMGEIFPPEEVLAFELWDEPLKDEGIRVFAAVHNGKVVGATEYRYYVDFNVAMTDFTIIGREGLGIGSFLAERRKRDLNVLAAASNQSLRGMFAEIYNPYLVEEEDFGGVKPMNPFVRREVLSHLGYHRLNFTYVHPSWKNDGEAVSGLDLCFLPFKGEEELETSLITAFLRRYYSVLSNKPQAWIDMVGKLEQKETVELLPL